MTTPQPLPLPSRASDQLITIGLIRQTYDNKRSTLEWMGIENMVSKLNHMVKSSFARLFFGLDSKAGHSPSGAKKCSPVLGASIFLGKRICIDPLEAEAFIAKRSLASQQRFESGVVSKVS